MVFSVCKFLDIGQPNRRIFLGVGRAELRVHRVWPAENDGCLEMSTLGVDIIAVLVGHEQF